VSPKTPHASSPAGSNGGIQVVSAGLTRTATSGWRFVIAKFNEPAGTVRIRDMSAGDESVVTRSSGQRDKLTAPIWIGSSRLGDSNRNDLLDIAQFGIKSGDVSDSTDTEIYEFVRDYYTRRPQTGIVV